MSTPAPPRSSSSGPSLSPTRQQLDDLEALMQRMLSLPVNHLHEDGDQAVEVADPPAHAEPAHVESDLDRILAEFPAKSWPSRDEPSEEDLPPEIDSFEPTPAESQDEARPPTVVELPPFPVPVRESEPVAEPSPDFAAGDNRTAATEDDTTESVPEEEAAPVVWTETARASMVLPDPVEQAAPAAWRDPPPVRREISAPSRPRSEPVRRPAVVDGPPVLFVLRPLVWVNDAFDLCSLCLGPLGRWLRGRWGRTLLGVAGLLLLAAAAAWGAFDWMGWTW